MALNWTDRVDGVDWISADDINAVAHAVIDLETAEYLPTPTTSGAFLMVVNGAWKESVLTNLDEEEF